MQKQSIFRQGLFSLEFAAQNQDMSLSKYPPLKWYIRRKKILSAVISIYPPKTASYPPNAQTEQTSNNNSSKTTKKGGPRTNTDSPSNVTYRDA
ncbi:hypothetical protein [Cytobacillus gottheilii]|uniref:hypothetical protein n=1 Tax=Cytobacillus gottheilii TaxID=859144 RepID=UPI0009BACD0C|nr:hypothetical protein [Cytobacillus gottheilii]